MNGQDIKKLYINKLRLKFRQLRNSIFTLSLALSVFSLNSCTEDPLFVHERGGVASCNTPGNRLPNKEVRRVLLLYSCGFNNLSSTLLEDIMDMENSVLPGTDKTEDVLLVYSHHSNGYSYNPVSPLLFRLSVNEKGTVVRDTLKVWPENSISASSQTLNEVLTLVKDEFPAREYDMIFSSHATGWLPIGYYSGRENKDSYTLTPTAVPDYGKYEIPFNGEYAYFERYLPQTGEPLTKSIGESWMGSKYNVYSMDMENFANAIPMKMGCILFDCCLMGGIEVAYSLRDKCDNILVSPAEVLSDGLNYSQLWEHLYGGYKTDPVSIARDYFEQYEKQSGDYRSATVTVVNCGEIEQLASACKNIFSKYGEEIRALDGTDIQAFHRKLGSVKTDYFFDLRDVCVKAGTDAELIAELDKALENCILYKNATATFMPNSGGFAITSYCGLTTYLPGAGSSTLDEAYKLTSWNQAAGLVK